MQFRGRHSAIRSALFSGFNSPAGQREARSPEQRHGLLERYVLKDMRGSAEGAATLTGIGVKRVTQIEDALGAAQNSLSCFATHGGQSR